MSVKIWRDNGLFVSTTTSSVECLKNNAMQIILYTLQHNETINIVPDDFDVTSTLIIVQGGLKMFSSKEVITLNTYDAVMLENIMQSLVVEAIGFTKLVLISNEAKKDSQEDKIVATILSKVEEKDIYTLGHNRRVSLYSKRLALAYDPSYNVISLSAAACMHDVGKINTPIEILRKPGRLTAEEYEIIKLHPQDSYDILKDRIGEKVAIAAKQHHERLDGSGYPDGLKSNEICMDAKIIAIADVFDSMTCKRIYNKPNQPLEVVKYLEDSPEKYDATIVSILRRKVEKCEMEDILTAFLGY